MTEKLRPSVLIEINRGLIGDPNDPMFEALNKGGVCVKQIDRRTALHKVMDEAVQAYQKEFIQG
jgi:hypothetical protein